MKLKTFALATAMTTLAAAAATPAFAAWDRVDSISVDSSQDRDAASPDFGGPVEKLRLTARESDIRCRSVSAVFGNNERTELFSGRLHRGESRVLDIPGAHRTIKRLNFNCRAQDGDGGRIIIEADVGRYRAQWLRSPNWSRVWGRATGMWDDNVNYWVPLGGQTFTGRHDNEMMATGWAGRSINSIGLKPTNDDARCSKVVATFQNGTSRELDISRWDHLTEDRMHRIDLPGADRNVTRLALHCRAEHGRSVTINIFANK